MPTLAAAAGTLSENDERLRVMLSNVAAFQSWTRTATAAAALEHVHLDGLPDPAGETYKPEELAGYRPFCIVSH